MPSWAIHLAVATQLNKKIKLNEQNKNIFLLGNILPDILNGYVIKNISHIVPHREAHMEIPVKIENHFEYRYDLKGFLEKYKEKFENPMMLGYYTHLLTDFYWNDLTYGRLGVFDKNKNLIGLKMYNEKIYMAPKAELRKIKTKDFKLFSKSIYENKCTDIPTYDEKMLVSDTVQMGIQVNGKLRAKIEVAKDADDEAVKELAFQQENVKAHTDGKNIVKVIVVKNKIVNIVVK